jgi:Protein of unknown function (DUF732)
VKKIATQAIAVATLVTAAIVFAPQALADSADQGFLTALQADAITSSGGNAELIHTGHEVCTLRQKGMSEEQVAGYVQSKSELAALDAAYFVDAAEAAYCPAYYED